MLHYFDLGLIARVIFSDTPAMRAPAGFVNLQYDGLFIKNSQQFWLILIAALVAYALIKLIYNLMSDAPFCSHKNSRFMGILKVLFRKCSLVFERKILPFVFTIAYYNYSIFSLVQMNTFAARNSL